MKAAACLTIILILVLNLVVGTMAFGYCCDTVFGKRPSKALCVVGGAITGEITIPGAVLLWLLRKADILHPPLVKP